MIFMKALSPELVAIATGATTANQFHFKLIQVECNVRGFI